MKKNKLILFLKEKIKNKNVRKQIVIGLIISLLILCIPIVGYSINSKPLSILAALFVTQSGIALLWLIFKKGFASTTRHAMRNSSALILKKKNKINKNFTRSNSPIELENTDSKKSSAGIWLMLSISVIYAIYILFYVLL